MEVAAICITDAGEQQVRVQIESDVGLTWNRRKYFRCLACFPDAHSTSGGVALYMQQKFSNPLQCGEQDLFSWMLPPPLDRAVLYGPVVIVVGIQKKQAEPLGMTAWRRLLQQGPGTGGLDSTWVTLETGAPGPLMEPCRSPTPAFAMKSSSTFPQEAPSLSENSYEDEESMEESDDYESDTSSSEEGDTDVQSNDDDEDNLATEDMTEEHEEYIVEDDFSTQPATKRRRYPLRRGGI